VIFFTPIFILISLMIIYFSLKRNCNYVQYNYTHENEYTFSGVNSINVNNNKITIQCDRDIQIPISTYGNNKNYKECLSAYSLQYSTQMYICCAEFGKVYSSLPSDTFEMMSHITNTINVYMIIVPVYTLLIMLMVYIWSNIFSYKKPKRMTIYNNKTYAGLNQIP